MLVDVVHSRSSQRKSQSKGHTQQSTVGVKDAIPDTAFADRGTKGLGKVLLKDSSGYGQHNLEHFV